mmetsp:Transcript_31115/g.52266  ORF Transcript_31115/g.52266 Transcript_31115/m.52266 type:complete len:300 (+) Transcript_31115:88-987(+)
MVASGMFIWICERSFILPRRGGGNLHTRDLSRLSRTSPVSHHASQTRNEDGSLDLYNKKHLPIFLSPIPVFPYTTATITASDASLIPLNAIIAGHRRFGVCYRDPVSKEIARVGCLAQVQNNRIAITAAHADENSHVITVRGERRLNICDIAEHPNPRNPFLYATVEEWTQEEEEGNEKQSQDISDGCAEFSLVKEILTSLNQLAQCYQQRGCASLEWLARPGVEWQLSAWSRGAELIGTRLSTTSARTWMRTFSYGLASKLPIISSDSQELLESSTFSRLWSEADWLRVQVRIHCDPL